MKANAQLLADFTQFVHYGHSYAVAKDGKNENADVDAI